MTEWNICIEFASYFGLFKRHIKNVTQLSKIIGFLCQSSPRKPLRRTSQKATGETNDGQGIRTNLQASIPHRISIGNEDHTEQSELWLKKKLDKDDATGLKPVILHQVRLYIM